jgi:hypothetical protein
MMRRSGAGFRRTELRLITHPKRTPPSTATGVERAVTIRQQQDVEFAASGRVVLCIEGPRATRRFANLYYEVSAHDGTRVKGRKIWFGPRTSGFSKARLGIESYEIPRPGRHTLRIQGLGTEWTADAEHRVVFTRPYLARSIVYVVGITLVGLLLIGSIFFFFLFLTEKGVSA